MSRPSSMEQFQTGDWERLQEAAEQFERAWRERTDVDLISFLPPADDPLYGAILEELVKIDLEIRRTHEQTVTLDFYLEKYPQLGDAKTVSARLIYEEYRVLSRFGGPVDPESYRQRFPKQFEELQRLIDQQSLPADTDTRSDSSLHADKPRTSMILQNGEVLPVGQGYRLIECMGEGTFGEVWKVEAPGGFPAAIKIVRRTLGSEESKREQRALEVIKRLSHPHLLKTQAAWASQDRLVILMDLADCTLRDRLRECKEGGASGIAPAELFRYLQEAAEALDYLHSEGVLHRDVKPQNLLLCKGHVKVADFGLIRDETQHQRSYSAAGTPGYMAPESWRGSPCAAGDQYGLALTYAELRLGRWPFDATDPMNVMLAHVEGTPDLSRLEEAEQSVILQGMAKKPAERFPDCQTFVSALREALPDVAAGANRTAAIRPLAAPPTRGMPRLESKMSAPRPAHGARPKAFATEGMDDLPSDGTMLPFDRSDEGAPPLDGSTVQVYPRRAGGEDKAASMNWQAASKARRYRFGWVETVVFVLAAAGAAVWFFRRPPSAPPLQIVRHISGQDLIFKLIHPEGQPDEPFYLMENKVSNAVFRALAHDERLDDDTKWQRGGVKESGDAGDYDDFPVLRVTRSEAERCAAWLGGSLPTARQLDLAFGHAEPPKAAAVHRIGLGPRKITEPHDDISLSGIRDLSGNGREWTSDSLTIQGKTFAILRGRSYAAQQPLLPIHLDEWKAHPELSPTQLADYASPYTGFRVALPLSAAAQK